MNWPVIIGIVLSVYAAYGIYRGRITSSNGETFGGMIVFYLSLSLLLDFGFSAGLMPVLRTLINFFSKSNQMGAPCMVAIAVRKMPNIFNVISPFVVGRLVYSTHSLPIIL